MVERDAREHGLEYRHAHGHVCSGAHDHPHDHAPGGTVSVSDRTGTWFATSPAGPLLVAAGAVCGCAALAVADPTTPGGPTPVCPTKALFGITCPGCGTARMLYSLTHFDLTGAIRYNAIALVAVVLLAWAWVVWMARTMGTRLPSWTSWKWLPHVTIAVLAIWTVVRLLPFAPFTALHV